ncbi:MAG TPA: LuxR C-terminal-related transcriptional regulator, partial [Microlunatus sp.]|nr:LuxR C-terminal-related transcriptional regulator [Microlunatus sp.]
DDGHEELLPEALSDLVRARVSGLSPEARELLLITAVTHRPTVARVARAVSRPVGQVVSGLDEAVDAGVLTRVSGSGELVFTHPLFAVGVVAVSPPGTRREAHRRAAVVAEGLEERAGHLAMAALEPDRDLADMLDRAAEHSLNRGAPETAAALAQDALRLTPTDTAIDSYRRAVTVAEYQFHAGEVTRARETLEDLLRRPAPKPERARALRVLGELLYHQDSYADAVEPLTQALTLTTDPDLRGHLLIHLAFADAGSGRFQEAREHAHAALLLADHVSDPGLLGSIFAVAAITDRLNGELLDERLLARALELEDPNQQRATALRPSLIAGHLRLYAGQLAQAEHHLTTILEEAVERGNESDVVLAAATLVWAECWSGDLDSAHAHARQAITTAERLGGDLGVCLACSFATVQYVFRGDLEAAGGCATRALALTEVSGYPVGSLWVWWGQAVGALAAGQPEEGAEAAEGMLNVVDLTGLPIPARVMGLADAIEVLVEMRQLDRADHYIDILLEAAERTQTAWARMTGLRCRALGHAAHGDLDRAETAVTEALRRADDSELVVEVARTHLVAGQIIRRRRRKREAAAHIEQALSAFEDAGAEGWATLAAAELARARPLTADTHGLSPTEERVAHLVASGLTNSEVANRLNISAKTVEANLTRIYHKLQIRSRAELGTHLAPLP